jgi:hypothetical protein
VGAAVPPMPPRPYDPGPKRKAVYALVVGVLSVVLFFPFGPILGAVAIWTGTKARMTMQGVPGRGLATGGVVLGSIGLTAGVVFFVLAGACDCL